MNAKNVITIILILFVAASLVYLLVSQTGDNSKIEYGQSLELETSVDTAAAKEGVVAYYFHRNKRCPTCNKIEELFVQTIHERFSEQLDNGTLHYEVINIEEAGNQHLEEDYELIAQAVVIVRNKEGVEREWKNLEKIWELAWDEKKFLDYVERETRTYLEQH